MITYVRVFFTYLPSFLIGLALVDLLWPRRGPQDGWIKLSLAPGLGWGITSCLFFFWMLAFNPAKPGFGILEWSLAVGLVLAALFTSRKDWRNVVGFRLRPAGLLPGTFALLLFLILVGLFWLRALAEPSGGFDAIAMWNLRARFLFLTRNDVWTIAFSPQLDLGTHADYPLLWPLTLLRSYLVVGRISNHGAVFMTSVFPIAVSGLFIAGLNRLGGKWQAILGGLLLMAIPNFFHFSGNQQVDIPLTFFYLAFVLLLLLAQLEPQGSSGLLVLAGLSAGCAAWTKNEGLLFLVAVLPAFFFDLARAPHSFRLRRLTSFMAGLTLPLAAVLVFKLCLAPPGDLIGVQSISELIAKLLDPSRYVTISSALLTQLVGLGGLPWVAVVGLIAFFLLAGPAHYRPPAWLFMPLGLTFLGYLAIFLITPRPLSWHLTYSLDRLVFQLLIPTLFLLLACTRNPEELVQAVKEK